MQSRNIDVFWGELFYHPVPLELSMNSCSHRCSYCFANSRSNTKTVNVKSVINCLKNTRDKTDLKNYLVRNKYPIVLSNKSDPFALSNYRLTIPIVEALTDNGTPIFFQTKGGPGIGEVLDIVKPSAWYISLSFDNDPSRGAIEKHSPTIKERLNLIEKLIDRGHLPIVGINPYVPSWFNDDRGFVKYLLSIGVKHFLFQLLHLNKKLLVNMPADHGISGYDLDWCQKRKLPIEIHTQFNNLIDFTESEGGHVLLHKRNRPMRFWDAIKPLYPKLYPTMFDFVNYVFENYSEKDEITFKDYHDFFAPKFPQETFNLRGYLFQQDMKYVSKHRLSYMNYSALLRHIWNHDFNDHPPRHPMFMYTIDNDKYLRDNEGNYIFTINKGGLYA